MKYLKKYRLTESRDWILYIPTYSDCGREILSNSNVDTEDIVDIFTLLELPLEIADTDKSIVNKSGNKVDISTTALDGDYYICHKIELKLKVKNILKKYDGIDVDEFNNILLNIVETNNKIIKFCDRIEKSKSVKIEILEKMENCVAGAEESKDIFIIFQLKILENRKLSTDIIKKIFEKWKNSRVIKDINDAMNMINKMYADRGVENPDIIFNDSALEYDEDIVPIGLSTEDEIIGIAYYSKKSHSTTIDKKEFEKSLREI